VAAGAEQHAPVSGFGVGSPQHAAAVEGAAATLQQAPAAADVVALVAWAACDGLGMVATPVDGGISRAGKDRRTSI
jgi:hypothetical protein